LNAPVVEDVWESITDQRVHERKHVKRARHERIGSIWPNFSPQPKSTWDELHQSIEFAACVDGRAQVVNTKEEETSILAGCQNGVIQLVCCDKDDLKVLECFHFPDCRLSTNIIDENQIFVCGTRHPKASRLSPGAKLMALSKDLALTHWSIETLATQSIQSSPIVWDNLLWIVSKKDDENHQSIHLYETKDGSSLENDHISLPFSVAANPLLCSSLQIERDDGSMATTVIVYASSDWDTGVVLVDVEKRCLLVNQTDSSNVFFAGEIGPVYKTIVFDSENKSIVISDSWGSIHRIELDTLSISSKKVTNFALSGPCLALDSDIVVGGYDGCVYRLSNDMTTILWSSDVCAVVYSRPLALLETENLIVCTTAGDVCVLDLLTGKGHWKTRLPVGGEIWSDPTEVPARNLETTAGFRQICFGARDSRLHFLKVTINIGTKKDQIC
jgi:PQQ-like domain